MQARGNPSSNRGRGNRGRGTGRGAVIAQLGKQRLIAEDLTGSSSKNDTMSYQQYQEFLKWKSSQEKKVTEDNMPPSYSSIITEDDNENIQSYIKTNYKELILFLEERDLQWKDEPWKLMARYLNSASYAACTYKYMGHYEMILNVTESCEISHFYPANTKKVFNFSKMIIKRIISAEEWGLSTLTERSYTHPEMKTPVKYNYWDYMDSFYKALLYENGNKKHSWFIKICSNVYKQSTIPNWFSQWWITYGPTVKILPKPLLSLYTEWVDVSPKVQELQRNNTLIEGSSYMNFFIEYSIPWIMKWSVEVDYTQHNIPALYRTFYTMFWKKMTQMTADGNLQCQDTVDSIKQSLEHYKQMDQERQVNTPSPYQHIFHKLKMKKGLVTKEEMLASYLEEVKKDLIKNLEYEIQSDTSMASANNTEDEGEYCLPGESQSITEEEANDYITNIITQVMTQQGNKDEESSKAQKAKGKDKIG